MTPITFKPLYMERVWGGRRLESVYGRSLPDPRAPFGEAWEVVDREDDQSVVSSGSLAGKSLHELWTDHRDEIFGPGMPASPRFPLLIKILDARDDLSIQVHPPAAVAPSLDGEPKTEMWFIADAEPGAKLYVGLQNGVTREQFERAITDGTVAECVHAIQPRAGDSIFIPSGRLHAIGGGLLIFEIQQNSDTTYRVFDWNRVGLDGNPRQLHVDESLASIDFDDFEPGMDEAEGNVIAECEHFRVERLAVAAAETVGNARADRFSILSVVEGRIEDANGKSYGPGEFLLLPAGAAALTAPKTTTILRTTIP